MEPKLKEKRWEKQFEDEIWQKWEKEGLYDFNFKNGKEIFSIDTPPPYPSGKPWHLGAAGHYSMIDMIARTARMKGYNVLFPMGMDRNGLPVEIHTEKLNKISMHNTPREKFVELCSTSLDDTEEYMYRIYKALGIGGDWKNRYRTDSKDYRAFTQATFIESWKKGLIYEATRPNNFCTKTRTTIADNEINYEEKPTKLVYLKFKIKGENKDVIIATTRPEMLNACAVALFNPKDERYKGMEGKILIVPLYNKEIKLISHPYAKPEFGSGIVMICSYGDYSDVRIFRELKLKETIMINENGTMTKNAGKYAGLPVEKAREEIIKDLFEANLVTKIENIMHRTPMSERGNVPIEIIPMKEYYLKQMDFVKEIEKIAEEIIFHPKEMKQILLDWLKSISQDWPISRRRYYGTEIPIWYCEACGKPWLPEPGEYYQPWKNPPPSYAKCECGSTKFKGEERTFDTWMDSSISALFISKYGKDDNLFKEAFPVTIRPQGKDIIRTWLYYTLLRVYQITGKPAFKHVWISGHGVDEHGEKMSKSKGNVVDPESVINEFGGDALRFWVAAEVNLGSDYRYSKEKVTSARNFLTKLWNISRFISSFEMPEKAENLNESDRWIISEMNEMIQKALEGYEEFNFYVPANSVKFFAWNLFADHYIEMCKQRAYKGDKGACYTLHLCLKNILKILAPITPFITEKIWQEIYSNQSLHTESFPLPSEEGRIKYTDFSSKIIEINSNIWKYKKERGKALNSELNSVYIFDKSLELFKDDLKTMHNIKNLEFGKPEREGSITYFENFAIVE